MPGKSHGWRSLVGYSPWGGKESDTAEQLHFFTFTALKHSVMISTVDKYFKETSAVKC